MLPFPSSLRSYYEGLALPTPALTVRAEESSLFYWKLTWQARGDEGDSQDTSQRNKVLAYERPGTPASQLDSQGTDLVHFKGAFSRPDLPRTHSISQSQSLQSYYYFFTFVLSGNSFCSTLPVLYKRPFSSSQGMWELKQSSCCSPNLMA